MADTGKSNGHLGIHHPFGARHGTPVAGQRPPLAGISRIAGGANLPQRLASGSRNSAGGG